VAPEVTVVIPTRNRERYVVRAVSTALGQRDVDLEVVVVDDGSTDGTAERLAAVEDDRLRVLPHGPPHGVARARNAGVGVARGAWLAFLDDDDIWAPRKLRSQLDVAGPEVGFVYAAAYHVDDSAEVFMVSNGPPADELLPALLAWNPVPGGCSGVIARTELVRAAGGFDEQLHELADWDLWIGVGTRTQAARCSEPLVAYVEHDENMLFRDRPDLRRELDYLAVKHAETLAAYGTTIDRRRVISWAGNQRRRLAAIHRDRGHVRTAARMFLEAARETRDPIDLARAAAALGGASMFGALRDAYRRIRRLPPPRPAVRPTWLEPYRGAGALRNSTLSR
jgi:glycosyltransferase involved in cell wall biosynthesis